MKILIIGGVAGGASAAARIRRLDENAEIIIFEKDNDVSFANCGIPYFCSGVIEDRTKLLVMTPQKLKSLLNVDARVNSEVVKINSKDKTITILDKITKKIYNESYDKLILSPGASPVIPNIPGITDKRVLTVRNLRDADKIKQIVNSNDAKNIAVIGAGFIGLEIAENIAHLGIKTHIIEKSKHVLPLIDNEIAAFVENHLIAKSIELHLNEEVKSIDTAKELTINLKDEKKLKVDFIILAIGVKPETKLAIDGGLKIGQSGGIHVNKYLETSIKNIYAIGDAIEVEDFILKTPAVIPLAGPANKQGRIVANNICNITSEYKATQGTSIIKIFDLAVGFTGKSERILKQKNIKYLKSFIHAGSHADYYPGSFPIALKLLYTIEGKILGAQAVGADGVDKRIDVIATAMRFEKKVNDLIELELCYAPPFGSAKDPVNLIGMVAQNNINSLVKDISIEEAEQMQNSILIDVRNDKERETGIIEGNIHIPLEEIRKRINEIPKDKNVILQCTRGRKSYFASRILLQKGYKNVYNLSGGYMLYKEITVNLQNKEKISIT